METSVLNTIKKLLGPSQDQTDFDIDIIVHINNAFSILHDLGVGPKEGFSIEDASAIWTDYISDNPVILNKVKTYVYLKTRLHFDPPSNTALLESMKESIKELEWRLNVNAETKSDSEG